jgi:hypothetical protein
MKFQSFSTNVIIGSFTDGWEVKGWRTHIPSCSSDFKGRNKEGMRKYFKLSGNPNSSWCKMYQKADLTAGSREWREKCSFLFSGCLMGMGWIKRNACKTALSQSLNLILPAEWWALLCYDFVYSIPEECVESLNLIFKPISFLQSK